MVLFITCFGSKVPFNDSAFYGIYRSSKYIVSKWLVSCKSTFEITFNEGGGGEMAEKKL